MPTWATVVQRSSDGLAYSLHEPEAPTPNRDLTPSPSRLLKNVSLAGKTS